MSGDTVTQLYGCKRPDVSRHTKMASARAARTAIVIAALLIGQTGANATDTTLTFDDVSNYSGGTAETPNTYSESGFMFTVPNGAENHLDPFTGANCDILGVLCWHDGPSNTIEDNILTLSLVSGGAFDLVQLDFVNQRALTALIVSSSAGDIMTITEGLGIAFGWTNITFVKFDIPGTTAAGTLPSLDNVVVNVSDASITETDTCDIGGGPNDIETVTASYDAATDAIVVEIGLCTDADNRTKYWVYFDHQDTTNLDGDGIDDGPDTLDPNPGCVQTWDDRMAHHGTEDGGPGTIEVDGDTMTYRVDVDELNPGLELGGTVLIWTGTKRRKVTDNAPTTEWGDRCAKPEVASEVIYLELR